MPTRQLSRIWIGFLATQTRNRILGQPGLHFTKPQQRRPNPCFGDFILSETDCENSGVGQPLLRGATCSSYMNEPSQVPRMMQLNPSMEKKLKFLLDDLVHILCDLLGT